jgi:hypothetical protein
MKPFFFFPFSPLQTLNLRLQKAAGNASKTLIGGEKQK